MKKNLFLISEEEKNRILGMHESATKRGYLTEQTAPAAQPTTGTQPTPTSETKVVNDQDYIYKKEGDKYFFKLQPDPKSERAKRQLSQKKFIDWTEAKGKGLDEIKKLNWSQSEKLPQKTVVGNTPKEVPQLAGRTTPATPTVAGTTPVATTPTATTPTATTPTATTPTATAAVTSTNPEIMTDLKTASEIRQEFRQGKRDVRKLQRQYNKMYNTYNKLSDKMDKATDDQYLTALSNLKTQLGQ
jgi:uncharacterized protein YhaN